MMRTLPLILALLFWASGIAAQSVELPALTGRVVDFIFHSIISIFKDSAT